MPIEHETLLARLQPLRQVITVARLERAQDGRQPSRVLRIARVHDVHVERVRGHALEDGRDASDEDEAHVTFGERA